MRQWLPSLFERLDRLVDKLAEFREYLFGIVAVATAIEQLRAAADEAVVFIRSLHDFHVSVALPHCLTSSMAA